MNINDYVNKELTKQESVDLAEYISTKYPTQELTNFLIMQSHNATLWAHIAVKGPQWTIPEDVRMNPEFRSLHTNLLIQQTDVTDIDTEEIELFFDFCSSEPVYEETPVHHVDIDDDVLVIMDEMDIPDAIPLEPYHYVPATPSETPHTLERSRESKERSLRMKIEDMQSRSMAMYLKGNMGAHMVMHQCLEDMMATFAKEFPEQERWLTGFKNRLDDVEAFQPSTVHVIREEVADLLRNQEDVLPYLVQHPERFRHFVTEDTERFMDPHILASWIIQVPALADYAYEFVPHALVEPHMIASFQNEPTQDNAVLLERVMLAPRYFDTLDADTWLTAHAMVGVSRQWGSVEAPVVLHANDKEAQTFDAVLMAVKHGSVADLDDAIMQYEACKVTEKQHQNMPL